MTGKRSFLFYMTDCTMSMIMITCRLHVDAC